MTTLYLFDEDQTLIHAIPSKDMIQARQTLEKPDDGELPIDQFTAIYKLEAYKDYESIHYMAVKDLEEDNAFHMYYVTQPIVKGHTVTLEGIQLGYRELKYFINSDIRPNGTARYVMGRVLEGSEWSVGYVSETDNQLNSFYYQPVLESLKELANAYGLELVFKVEISGQQITDKWVEAYNRRGPRTMKRFTHGENALSIKATIDRSGLYTALIGRGRGEEIEDSDGFGRAIQFADVEWSVANGDPVDKPLGQNYVELPEATDEFGVVMRDGSKAPAMGVFEDDQIEDPAELLQATYNELVQRSRPLVEYQSTVAKMGKAELGETVTVHRYDLDLHYETRIFKLVIDYLNPKRTEVELGDHVVESRQARESRTQRTIANLTRDQQRIREEVSYVVRTADGFNRTTYGNVEPEERRVGDYWVRDHPVHEEHTQSLIWTGDAWELLIDTSRDDEVSRQVDEAISEAQDAKAQVEREAEDRRADIQAESERLSAEWNERIEENEQIIEDVRQSTEELMDDFDRALTQAGFTTIEDLTTTLNTRSLEAIENASESLRIAEEADGYAFEALEIVNGFGTRITDVENTVEGQVTSINTAIATAERVEQELTRVEDVAEGARVVANRVEETAEGWSREISEVRGDLEGLTVGGRNLVRNSTFNFGRDYWRTAAFIEESTNILPPEPDKPNSHILEVDLPTDRSAPIFSMPENRPFIEPETRLIVSFDIWVSDNNRDDPIITVRRYSEKDGSGNGSSGFLFDISNSYSVSVSQLEREGLITFGEWNRVELKGRTGTALGYYSVGPYLHRAGQHYKLREIQLEESTVPTPWTPAPEDYDARFVSMEADIEGITNTVSDYDGRISRTEQRADGLYDVVHDPNTGLLTEVGQIAEGWQVTAQRIDDLSVGGRNLLRNSDFSDGLTYMNGWNTNRGLVNDDEYGEVLRVRPTNSSNFFSFSSLTEEFYEGEEVVISFYAKGQGRISQIRLGGSGSNAYSVTNSNTADIDTNEWRQYSFKTSVIRDSIGTNTQLRMAAYDTDNLLLTRFKVSKSNVKSDWTPAPEDMASQADITVLHNAIDLAVEEGDVIGRLNIQAGHTLIQNGEILMDADTVRFTGSAFIPNAAIEEVSANKIIGNDGEFNTLRSRFLTSNVIESDHLNVTTAMIDRFFANSALIERLTSQEAFIDQLSASNLEIDGGRVHGTLNGNSLNFVNIDVNSLSGNLSEFVRTQWNNATNGHVLVDGDGINMSNQGSTMRIADAQLEFNRVDHFNNEYNGMLTPERIYFATDTGRWVQIGHEGVIFRENGRTARLRFNGDNYVFDTNVGLYRNHINSVDWIRIIGQEGDTMDTAIFNSPNHPGSIIADTRQLTIGLGSREEISRIASFSGNIQFMRNLFMQGNNISGVQRLSLEESTTELLTASDNASGVLRSGQRLILGIRTGSGIANTSQRIEITGRIDMHRNVWMNGNTMYGQVGNESDRRLKMGVEETEQDSLSIIRKLDFVEYEWIDKEKYGYEQKFGLIAQDVDDCLSLYDEESDIYSINSTRLTLVNSHAIQQLFNQHENTLKVASHAYLLAEQHEDELACYKKKIEELEKKVERLEGAA